MSDPQPPTVVEVDDWISTSSSASQPTKEEMVERLTDNETDKAPPHVTAAADPVEPVKEKETAVAEDEPVEEPAAEVKPGEKKPQSSKERHAEMQARFAAETKAYHDARRMREAEEADIAKLREERAALAKPKEGEAPAKPTTDDEMPVWSKWEDEDKTFDEFMVARDAYVRKAALKDIQGQQAERDKVIQERDAQARAQRSSEQHAQRIDKVREQYPDFAEKVTANLADVPSSPFVDLVVQHHDQGAELLYYFASNPDEARAASALTPSRPIADAIMYSDTPIELVAYFAQNPRECDRLSRLHPATALVALGELKAQLRGAKEGSPVPVPTVSNSKPPIRPVGGARAASVKNPIDADFGPEYVRAANEAEKKARANRYL